MKTFDQFIREQSNDLNESRFLRKGGALLLARSAKKHGDDATRSLTDAKRKIKGSSLDSDEERLKGIQDGLQDLCDGFISMRKQNGAITGIVTTAVLFNERTNAHIRKTTQERDLGICILGKHPIKFGRLPKINGVRNELK